MESSVDSVTYSRKIKTIHGYPGLFFTCYTAFMVIVLTLVGKTVIANIAKIYILQGVLSLVRKSIAKGIFQNATL